MSKKRTTIAKSSKTSRDASTGSPQKRTRKVTTINRPSSSFYHTQDLSSTLERLTREAVRKSIERSFGHPSITLRAAHANIAVGDWQSALLGIPQIASDAVWTKATVEMMNQNGMNAVQHHTGAWDISVIAESGFGRHARHEVKVASPSQGRFQASFSPEQCVKGNNLLFIVHPEPNSLDSSKFIHIGFNDLMKLRESSAEKGASLWVQPENTGKAALSVKLDVILGRPHSIITPRMLSIDEFAAYAANGLR